MHTTNQVSTMTGLSYRQLSRWAAEGAVVPAEPPAGSGSHTVWSDQDIERLKVLQRLQKHPVFAGGMPLPVVAAVWVALIAYGMRGWLCVTSYGEAIVFATANDLLGLNTPLIIMDLEEQP